MSIFQYHVNFLHHQDKQNFLLGISTRQNKNTFYELYFG